MGISDRDYHRGPAAGEVWYLKRRSLTAGLMAAQLLLFLVNARLAASRQHDDLDWLLDRPAPTTPAEVAALRVRLAGPVYGSAHFSADEAVSGRQVWRAVTFQFVHDSAPELVFSLVLLGVFGPVVEAYAGTARYALLYVAAGLAAAGAYMGMTWAGGFPAGGAEPMAGGLPAALAMVVAAMATAPDAEYVRWQEHPVTLGLLGWIALATAAAATFVPTVRFLGPDQVRPAALGGAAVGLAVGWRRWWPIVMSTMAGPEVARPRRGPRRTRRRPGDEP
jgi:membrane associated rhomboid family serine protease